MDPEAIHAEVERRKKRAEDLKIRETVWELYKNHLKSYPFWAVQLPYFIHPQIADPLDLSGKGVQVTIGGKRFSFLHKEGPPLHPPIPGEISSFATLSLMIDDALVLEFFVNGDCAMKANAEWRYSLSQVNAFVEGPWVDTLRRLLPGVRGHEASASKKRAQQLKEDPKNIDDLKKRFGL